MKLSQRMINNFCSSISASSSHRWTTLSGVNDDGVRVTTHKSTDPGQPNGVVLSAATSLWLPVSAQTVFNFFRDERTRAQVTSLVNSRHLTPFKNSLSGAETWDLIFSFY